MCLCLVCVYKRTDDAIKNRNLECQECLSWLLLKAVVNNQVPKNQKDSRSPAHHARMGGKKIKIASVEMRGFEKKRPNTVSSYRISHSPGEDISSTITARMRWRLSRPSVRSPILDGAWKPRCRCSLAARFRRAGDDGTREPHATDGSKKNPS